MEAAPPICRLPAADISPVFADQGSKMTQTTTERLRAICLALPEATERPMFEDPCFRVREKIFAMEKRGDGRPSLWCKAPSGSQQVLIGADPGRFFAPPYVGPKGWIGVRLDDDPDWAQVAILVRRSYTLVAPRRLSAGLEKPATRGT